MVVMDFLTLLLLVQKYVILAQKNEVEHFLMSTQYIGWEKEREGNIT